MEKATRSTASTLQRHSYQPPEEVEEMVQAVNHNSISNSSFCCPFCSQHKGFTCSMCKGKGTIPNSTQFSKFVSSIVDYKMERSEEVPSLISSKSHVKHYEQSRITSVSVRQVSDKKLWDQQMDCSYEDRFTVYFKSSMKPSQRSVSHVGIECDECHIIPIVGTRYKCKQCQDYDLCSKCYQTTIHQHKQFNSITQTKRDFQKQKLRKQVHEQTSKDCSKLGDILSQMNSLFR